MIDGIGWTQFRPGTGQFGQQCMCRDADASSYITPDWHVVEGLWNGSTHYMGPNFPLERQPSAITRTGLVLDNVPAGAVLHIDDQQYSLTAGGQITLNFPVPGAYQLRVEAFPHLDWTDTVTV